MTWSAESTEHAVVKTQNGIRTWHDLTHLSNTEYGFWALGDMDVYNPVFISTVHVGANNSSMEVDYQLLYKPSIGSYTGPGFKSRKFWAAATWNAQFVKQ